MKTYFFRADLVLDTPLHLGSGAGHEFIDSLVLRDGPGQPLISGTSLCGLLASHARDRLRLETVAPDAAEREPVFQALFGSAREATQGRESRLVMLDAPIIGKSSPSTFVQDRNSINRDRGSAEYGHLFHDEVVAAGARFQWACEFREKETGDEEKALTAAGRDPNREALRLLLESLEVLERGYCTLGGKTGTGHGRFRLEQLHGFWMDHQEPDDVLTFALEGPEAFKTRHPLTPQQRSATFAQSPIHVTTPASQKGSRPGPECIIFRGVLRPLDPLLVKTGYSMESVPLTGSLRERSVGVPQPLIGQQQVEQAIAVDAAFTRNEKGLPYLPGSSLRGCLRSHAERIIRTLIYSRFTDDQIARSAAWDVQKLEHQGRHLRRLSQPYDVDVVYGQSCLISRLFGSPALGGRLRFFDAFPVNSDHFQERLKLLDHVAIDRWTGGAAEHKKFNSRPFVPFYPDTTWNFGTTLPDAAGDLIFEVHLIDVEAWQLGLVALLLKDLHCRRLQIGYGKNKGFGRVILLPQHTELEALTHGNGLLSRLAPDAASRIGGFFHVPRQALRPGNSFWLSPNEEPLYTVIKEAVQAFRQQIRQWTPSEGQGTEEKQS